MVKKYNNKIKAWEYDLNLKEQYPEIYITRFYPLLLNVAMGMLALEITTNSLRKAKIIKRTYHKRNCVKSR
jgi:hypothetical protein